MKGITIPDFYWKFDVQDCVFIIGPECPNCKHKVNDHQLITDIYNKRVANLLNGTHKIIMSSYKSDLKCPNPIKLRSKSRLIFPAYACKDVDNKFILTVIAGWFFTAFLAFSVCFLIALLISWGG